MKRRSSSLCLALLVMCIAIPQAISGETKTSPLTLSTIMADPDWIGLFPEQPYWADDGESIYYERKQEGSESRDLINLNLAGGSPEQLNEDQRWKADVRGGVYSSDRRTKLYTRSGDLYLKDLENGQVRQLTRTSDHESDAAFLDEEDAIQFRRGGRLFIRNLTSGLETELPALREEDEPKDEESEDFLEKDQLELFDFLQQQKSQREENEATREQERKADPERVGEPFYLGKQTRVLQQELSPSARWLAVRTADKSGEKESRRDVMPRWIREDGYVEADKVRSLVGDEHPQDESLKIIDLHSRTVHEIDLKNLPSRDSDPLAFLDSEAPKDDDASPAKRPISLRTLEFSPGGSRLLFQAFSADNKDRWIACVDLSGVDSVVPRLDVLHHWRDEAWINGRFARAGWIPEQEEIWYLSEDSGFSHLFRQEPTDRESTSLTQGEFEVSDVHWSHDGSTAYFIANEEHPGIHEVYRVPREHGEKEQLTHLRGQVSFTLSPDETQLLLEYSGRLAPTELYLQSNELGAEARRLTDSASDAFTSREWTLPEIVTVPSRHGKPIHARLYQPSAPLPSGEKRPAVFFVHGAGYLQNAHYGWSYYFREFMFHHLLAEKGYLVLDMDYRASAGYGRDWRTAIYRKMGTPELEDLEDGVRWLAEEHGADPERVGVYGGSYGGFLTLMALFQQPDLFACGAALRPVTDWAHYNHGYTSNILNTPKRDPEAYRASSPIYFAEGLTKPLLMCHGMLDDNVFVKDVIRLSQRLIELEKENWELALYPVEAHGFQTPSAWLDEYRRILKLFETHLNPATP